MSKQLIFEDLTGGINNVDTKGLLNSTTKKTQSPEMVNVEYFKLGGIKSMEGNTQVGNVQDTAIVGGWEYTHKNKRDMIIGTKHGDVKIYNEQYNTFDTIYTFPSNSDRMSFCNINNGVIVTNGKDDLLFYDNTRNTQLTGSISVTNGSQNVTGNGTSFTEQLHKGTYITIQNCIGEYKVDLVTDDTHLTLDRNIELEQGVLYRAWSGEEQSIIVETTGTTNVTQGEPVTVDLDIYSSYPYTYTAVGNGVNKTSTSIQGGKFICNGTIYSCVKVNDIPTLREYSRCGSNNTCVSNNLFIGNGGNLYKFNGYLSNPVVVDNTGGWTTINDYIGIKNGKLYSVYNTPITGLVSGIIDNSGVEEWTYVCEGTLYASGIIGTGPILYAIGDGELYKLVINFTDNSSTITKITNTNFVNNKWGKILGYSYNQSGERPYYLTAHVLNNGNLYRIYSTHSNNVVTKIGSSNLWTEISGYSDLASGEYIAQVVGIYNGELRIINNPSTLDGTTTTTTLIDTDVKCVYGYVQYMNISTNQVYPLYISNNGVLKTLRYNSSQNATIPVIIDSSNIFTKLLQCNSIGKYNSTDDYYYTKTIFASIRSDNKCVTGGVDIRRNNPSYYPISLLDTTIHWENSPSSPTFDYLNLNVSNVSSGDTIEIDFNYVDKTYYDLYETFGQDVYYAPNNSSELNNISYLTTSNNYISFKLTETDNNVTTYKYGTYYRNKDSDSLNSSETALSSNLIFRLGNISLIPTQITDTRDTSTLQPGDEILREPVNFKGLAIQYYKGRLWIGGTDDDGNGILVYSSVGLSGNPFDIVNDAGYFVDMYNDSSPVLALGLFSDFMTIHKEFNTYLLTDSGYSDADNAMQITPFSNITCKSQQSWIVSNTKYFVYSDDFNDIYPLVQHTVWNDRFLGEPISQKIRNLFSEVRLFDTDEIFCVSRPLARQMLFYMPTNNNAGSNYAVIYDFQTKSWLLRVVPQEVTIAFNYNNNIYIGTADGKVLKEFSGNTFDGQPIVAYYKSPWFDWLGGYLQSFAEFEIEIDSSYNNDFYIRTQKDGQSRYEDRNVTNNLLQGSALIWGGIDDFNNTTTWDNDKWVRQTFENIRMLLPNNVFEDFQIEIGTNKLGQGFAIYGYKFRRIEAEECPW